jgi:hypothetical protein
MILQFNVDAILQLRDVKFKTSINLVLSLIINEIKILFVSHFTNHVKKFKEEVRWPHGLKLKTLKKSLLEKIF